MSRLVHIRLYLSATFARLLKRSSVTTALIVTMAMANAAATWVVNQAHPAAALTLAGTNALASILVLQGIFDLRRHE